MKTGAAVAALGLAQILCAGCTDAQLAQDIYTPPPAQATTEVTGEFCSQLPDPSQFPVRILFIIDISGSMAQSDPQPPNGLTRRAQAIVDTMNKYPPGAGVEYGVISFASNASILTMGTNGLSGFTADANQVITVVPSLSAVNGQTNYDGALSLAFQMLQSDMDTFDTTTRARSRYEIVFMSDGAPDPDTAGPGESVPPDVRADVLDIAGLQSTQQLGLIALNTVFIDPPNAPPSETLQASALLSGMANLANGIFREVDTTQSINLFYIDFTSLVRSFTLKTFVASNTSERPIAGPGGVGTVAAPDSDGDGLDDATEALIGTSPLLVDTDGDGFSDLLEYNLRNSGFSPLYPDDADCPDVTDREDSDGDGLLNCEERYIGTSLQLQDTDADGYSDDLEYRYGTNPIIADNFGDLDFDGAPNGFELTNHTDPLRNDSADFSQIAYRYDLDGLDSAASGPAGQTCYRFSIGNVTLVPTLDHVPGVPSGERNTILLHVTTTPSDNPDDPGSHQIACVRPSYETAASKTLVVPLAAFKTPGLGPDGGVGFDENRDCVIP